MPANEPSSVSPLHATSREKALARLDGHELHPFDPYFARLVAAWIQDDQELFWLAPKTPPPITHEKVLGWAADRDHPRLVRQACDLRPVAYGELHYMPGSRTHLWLGHLLVAPYCRGKGVGGFLTQLLLAEAFGVHAAQRVSLIVFPANIAAIRCYQRSGMVQAGYQNRFFETTGQHHRMLAMTIDRKWYRRQSHF